MVKKTRRARPGPLFVHLRSRSSYSLLQGALHIKALADLCRARRMPALALTDTNNMFGALEFSECLAASGIQPIVGITLAVRLAGTRRKPAAPGEEVAEIAGSLALLAKDETGYRNLLSLASRAYFGSDELARPHVSGDDLKACSTGLVVLTGGPEGPVNQALGAHSPNLAKNRLCWLREVFGDRLYVELQRHGLDAEREVEGALVDLAYELSLPLVATNDPHFAAEADYRSHDALLAIAAGTLLSDENRPRLSPRHYFTSAEEMIETFSDLPEAIENTIEIARRCAFRPLTHAPMLPGYLAGGGGQANGAGEAGELRRQATAGLKARLETHATAPGFDRADYEERLRFELDVIIEMAFAGYFLIVADFIQWAKAQGIPVGPGRGSGAGSLVAWALTITDLDPLRFGLLFERFLNPERVSMPDFDVDFCQDRRDEVIAYVQQKYGCAQVAQIITFGKLQARAVLRDVGRVLGLPYGQVDRLCKMIPNNPADPTTLGEAIGTEVRLREARDNEEGVAQLLEISLKLEGLYRHASTHAAGIVIADRPLQEVAPLYRDPRSDMPVTQFSMKWAEAAGLVKFDFLGLKTLTVIERAVRLIAEHGAPPDIDNLALDDADTFDVLARGETVGIFQLESSGMREALRKLKPDRIEDIIAMVALYRPGPMANIDTFIARKKGEEEPDFLHPSLEPILTETYGVIIYQEQVMEIARVLSGYSLGEADLLRRAMGKKIKSEMDRQKARFVEGATERGVDRNRAQFIFELVAKFAGYGFNKSHAAAYALVAYQTAFLKTHHAREFLAASMTLDMGNTDKLFVFKQEIERLGIKLKAPSINFSRTEFWVDGESIHYALAALKNVGRLAIDHIVAVREEGGPFRNLDDFASRISPRFVNKRALESLIKAGAFDEFSTNRAQLLGGVQTILGLAHRSEDDRQQGQNDLFGGAESGATAIVLGGEEPWLPMDTLAREFEAVGFFLSGHPLEEYRDVLANAGVLPIAELRDKVHAGESAGKVAGTISFRQERRTKTGDRFAIIGCSDTSGQYDARVFSDVLAQSRDLLETGQSVVLTVEASRRDDDISLTVQSVTGLDSIAGRASSGFRVFLDDAAPLNSLVRRLDPDGPDSVRLTVLLEDGGREVDIVLPGTYATGPRVRSAIKAIDGVIEVRDL